MADIVAWNRIQSRSVDALYNGIQRGINPALQCATGGGKTKIGALLALRLAEMGRVLFIAPSEEIVTSFFDELTETCGQRIGIDKAGFPRPKGERIIVGSLQSLGRSREGRLTAYRPGEFAAIIWDEGDGNAVANLQTRNIARHFGVVNEAGRRIDSSVRQVGLSATWQRHDGVSLTGEVGLFDELVDEVSREELEASGILVHPTLDAQYLDIEVPLNRMGQVDDNEWARRIEANQVSDAAVQLYLAKYAAMQAIFFCPTVDHAIALDKRLRARGVRSCCVHGETPKALREVYYHGLKAGQLQAVCNCDVFTRGTNIPSLGIAFHLALTRSNTRRIQRGGRVARSWSADDWDAQMERHGLPWNGDHLGLQRRKTCCVEVDYVGTCRLPLALPPSLLGPELETEPKDPHSHRAPRREVDNRPFTGQARSGDSQPMADDPVEFGWYRSGDAWVMGTPRGDLRIAPDPDEGFLLGFNGVQEWFGERLLAFRFAHKLLRVVHPAFSGGSREEISEDDMFAMYRTLRG